MTKEISTDAELMSRLLTTQPTPAECLVAAARIEQLATAIAAERAKTAKLVGAVDRWAECDDDGQVDEIIKELLTARAAITEADNE